MYKLQLLLCLAFAWHHGHVDAVTGSSASAGASKAPTSVGMLDTVLRGGKSRQSRCVRCYEDRYYGSSSGGDRYGGYSSRSGDEGRGSWYYPSASYDRYEDRGSSRDRDYYRDSYFYPEDRYGSRSYDRYEGRGYDDYRRGGSYERGGSYDRDRGYGYDNRDRYYTDRYSDSRGGDRYYDRPRYSGHDRYYSRYDFRNYRPWDETYRGQSGFDNSGRGYYFASDDDNRGYAPPYDRERAQSSASASPSPCGHLVRNCPYAGGSSFGSGQGDRGTKVSSAAIGNDSSRGGGHTSVMGQTADGKQPNGQGTWTYLNDQDKQNSRGGNGGGSGSGSGGIRDDGRDRERNQQSSSYGGRPRPIGGSYLFDRDSNAVPEGQNEAANVAGGGGGGVGGAAMPAAAAQTAPAASGESNAKEPQNAMQ
ncbi:keratin, type I cytoskeletal 9 [Scaptodrosophila lebanonensis]|uniref:Keratin, type I cytoskeletal 9 n=1 Tax=Drosophila lebanonensis TaxID=7225 RepID=A0A6J2UJK4_DROLE|nr:keratin, type I cytoskeletal 9 [Scaptodrosophila lebanonensis]